MIEGDDRSDVVSSARPQTARKDSRKIPGGFGIDDEDDLSPTKPNFGNLTPFNTDGHTSNDNRIPSLDISGLPSLPPEGSSLLAASDNEGDHTEAHLDSLDEREMRRHLMDIESSMLPALSPVGQAGHLGLDDTYFFDGARPAQSSPIHIADISTPGKQASARDAMDDSTSSPPTPQDAYSTPAPARTNIPEGSDVSAGLEGNTTSSLETMSSSPTAAAARRTISRAISMASTGRSETADDQSAGQSQLDTDENHDCDSTPKKIIREATLQEDYSDENSTVRYQESPTSLNHLSADAGNTPGAALLSRRSSGKIPKFLRSRHASQRSSVSSFTSNTDYHDDRSDVTLGADYALQTGGAVPTVGTSRSSSYMLSRSISLGSMASGIEDSASNGDILNGDKALATLTEEDRNRDWKPTDSKEEHSQPKTPRGTNQSLAPTDTVIAQHVRNVHVPESLAKEYRSQNRFLSPERQSSLATHSLGRNGRNLTLKEQSSTIERLSKENFDLKLKVMFLSDRLDKLSEEGVKEMISENVELKTGLATMQRDNKALKRKIKELEQKLKAEEGRPDTARSENSSDERSPHWYDQEEAQEREEELIYLRERVEEYVTEIEKLRSESLNREADKRKLAELVRNMGERRGDNVESREEMDVWKDLLEQETARREQSDEDNRKLRDEIFRLKSEASGGGSSLNHATNIYNIGKRRQISPSRPRSVMSDRVGERTGAPSAASTLVEELRKESEQLRHENAELRREVSAQTSMLTSRNREKERLYQEIEDLKLGQRRGGSVAGESIFERSASRAHERSSSRTSAGTTKPTALEDLERDGLESKNEELRDRINALKLQNQELQRELETCMEDFEVAVEAKKEAETLATELQDELEATVSDLQGMQAERDDALRAQDHAEGEFEALRKEAQEEIDTLEAEAEQKNDEIERLQTELADRTENFEALQAEMRAMSDSLVKLEDEQDAKARRIQELEQELEDANRELEEIEKTLIEANEKVNRLTVQQESSQGEIAFLREEQESDKMKIGNLESALESAEASLRDEKERAKELEQRLTDERRQRELIAGKEKEEVQKYVNDLNRESSRAKDEIRRLRKSLTSQEVEATGWKERLMELENNLREALGDINGTRSSLLKVGEAGFSLVKANTLQGIAKLQQELENTMRELSATKNSLAEKDRLIQQRDELLESHGLESRKLKEILEKERQAHRSTKNDHETFLKTFQHTSRTATQNESRILELETARQQDRKKMTALENTFKDQLNERNALLLKLWDRLSALCGSDWTHNNSLINGRALPSLEAVSTMLPGFSKNLLAAVKTIESLVGSFKSQVRVVEKDLWKEYQNLEHSLDMRSKKLDRLETMVKSSVGTGGGGVTSGNEKAEIAKLKEMNRILKEQLASMRNAEKRARRIDDFAPPSPAPSVPTGPRNKNLDRTSTLTRHNNASTAESLDHVSSTTSLLKPGSVNGSMNDEAGEQRWIFRLRELERRLKAEREARLLDRSGARKRLEEGEKRNEELKAELERNRAKLH
jgi:predicted  nucleic acid-binding Zn-ribbon protein